MTSNRNSISKGMPGASHNRMRDVSLNEVLSQLIRLFDFLGLDSSMLASRIRISDRRNHVSHHSVPHASVIGELLSTWHQDLQFVDRQGNPLPLAPTGRGKSFSSLARKAVPQADPTRLFNELHQIGAVAFDHLGRVVPLVRSLPVYRDKRLAIKYTLASLDSFVRTLLYNLESPAAGTEQLFHRIAWSGSIDAQQIPALKIRVKRQGQLFLESCDNWMNQKSARRKKSINAQVSVGVFMSVR